jgi:hypothetical protein
MRHLYQLMVQWCVQVERHWTIRHSRHIHDYYSGSRLQDATASTDVTLSRRWLEWSGFPVQDCCIWTPLSPARRLVVYRSPCPFDMLNDMNVLKALFFSSVRWRFALNSTARLVGLLATSRELRKALSTYPIRYDRHHIKSRCQSQPFRSFGDFPQPSDLPLAKIVQSRVCSF